MAGSDGLLRLQSTTSGTVGTTGYVVSLNKLNFEGYRRDQANGDPYGSADRFHLNARLVQPIGGGELGITFNHLDLDAENPGSLNLALFEEDPRQVRDFSYTNNGTGKEVQQTQLGVTWTGPVGGLTAEAAVYGLTRDFLNPLPGDIVDVDRRSGGARLVLSHATTSGDIGIEVRGGADVDFQDDDRREYDNNGGVPDVATRNGDTVRQRRRALSPDFRVHERARQPDGGNPLRPHALRGRRSIPRHSGRRRRRLGQALYGRDQPDGWRSCRCPTRGWLLRQLCGVLPDAHHGGVGQSRDRLRRVQPGLGTTDGQDLRGGRARDRTGTASPTS